VLEISKHASDELKRVYVEVLPLTYYGKHDSDSNIKSVWDDVWEDNTAGKTLLVVKKREFFKFNNPIIN
jgi:proteasome component ECM29